jgi:hypothetical protein
MKPVAPMTSTAMSASSSGTRVHCLAIMRQSALIFQSPAGERTPGEPRRALDAQ